MENITKPVEKSPKLDGEDVKAEGSVATNKINDTVKVEGSVSGDGIEATVKVSEGLDNTDGHTETVGEFEINIKPVKLLGHVTNGLFKVVITKGGKAVVDYNTMDSNPRMQAINMIDDQLKDLDDETLFNIDGVEVEEPMEIAENVIEDDADLQRNEYMLLGRLQQDCRYFLKHGGRAVKHLYHDTVEAHIADMRRLYDLLNEKPEWITLEEIDQYEQEMLNEPSEPLVDQETIEPIQETEEIDPYAGLDIEALKDELLAAKEEIASLTLGSEITDEFISTEMEDFNEDFLTAVSSGEDEDITLDYFNGMESDDVNFIMESIKRGKVSTVDKATKLRENLINTRKKPLEEKKETKVEPIKESNTINGVEFNPNWL